MRGVAASSRKIRMKKIVLTANDDRGLDGAMSMHFGRGGPVGMAP